MGGAACRYAVETQLRNFVAQGATLLASNSSQFGDLSVTMFNVRLDLTPKTSICCCDVIGMRCSSLITTYISDIRF